MKTSDPRVVEFCDWLDTIPTTPPFHAHPGFSAFADLTDGQIDAARVEMLRRAQAAQAEADNLQASRLSHGASAQPITTAPLDDRWLLLQEADGSTDGCSPSPWVIGTRCDGGWMTDGFGPIDAVAWAPLPDPQPKGSGWRPPEGKVILAEVDPNGWTDQHGKPTAGWRYIVSVERPDGSYDAYRDCDVRSDYASGRACAEDWSKKLGLPILELPRATNVVKFPQARS